MLVGSKCKTNTCACGILMTLKMECGVPSLQEENWTHLLFRHNSQIYNRQIAAVVYRILIIKPTRCTNFSNLLLE